MAMVQHRVIPNHLKNRNEVDQSTLQKATAHVQQGLLSEWRFLFIG